MATNLQSVPNVPALCGAGWQQVHNSNFLTYVFAFYNIFNDIVSRAPRKRSPIAKKIWLPIQLRDHMSTHPPIRLHHYKLSS